MPEKRTEQKVVPPPLSRRLDQSGGAISLWVVLMVPVAAFAAVVAMAGPQRMAAESSLQEAADDLATMAVTLRDGTNKPEGEIEGFLRGCPDETDDPLFGVCELLLGHETGDGGYLHRDLGNLGIDTIFWEGFYSDSLVPTSQSPDPYSPPYYGNSLDPRNVSCPVPKDLETDLETRNAVYVALAADWESGGWAAAQAWPDGVRMGTKTVARLNQEKLPWTPDDADCPRPSQPLDSVRSRTVFSD